MAKAAALLLLLVAALLLLGPCDGRELKGSGAEEKATVAGIAHSDDGR